MTALKEELAYFEQCKPTMISTHGGQFALIKGTTLAGTFTTFEEAYNAGLATFGNVPFLIKQIMETDPVQHLPAFTLGLLSATL